jgi:hypothetical protein
VQGERRRGANWAQVRERIDRGETGDKKAAEDPAAAPLGTDEEAGGSSTAPEVIQRSEKAEQGGTGTRAAAQGRELVRARLPFVILGSAALLVIAGAIALAVLGG